jgi:histidine triad (HIT) family protein
MALSSTAQVPAADDHCLFCRIVRAEIPADIVFQDEHCTVFRDIAPQAPVHLLIVPNTHVESHAHVCEPELFARVLCTAQGAAKKFDLSDYRLVMNTGAGAGQSVFHLHVHLLAGRPLAWPPG